MHRALACVHSWLARGLNSTSVLFRCLPLPRTARLFDSLHTAMQHAHSLVHPNSCSGRLTARLSGHTSTHSVVRPSFRGASRWVPHAAPETSESGSQDPEKKPVVRRLRKRLFTGESSEDSSSNSTSSSSSSSSGRPRATPATRKRQGQAVSVKDELEDFAAAFESLAVAPKASSSQSVRSSTASDDGEDYSYLGRGGESPSSFSGRRGSEGRGAGGSSQRGSRGSSSERGGRGSSSSGGGLYGRTSSSGSYGSLAKQGGQSWNVRGKRTKKELTLEDFEGQDPDTLSPAKQKVLAELQEEAEKAERRRLMAKARSEAIPKQPKPNQDPIIFQAITRQWDEKMTREELRGARAAARKVARVGLYDRNRALKAVRRKAVQALTKKSPEELTEEEIIIAQRAKEIREAAAAKSIQRTKEELAQEAMGVPRSYARAEALPEGMWEDLKFKYRSDVVTIKIGRRGATPALVTSVQNAWRGTEVVKLRIHDDKSSRKMNLPRINLLLRELEELSGGVLLDATGSSIWLYRGVDWQPPPPPPVYKPPPEEDMLQEQYSPRGTWQDIGGVTCYVTSSSSSKDSSSSSSVLPGPDDAMTVLLLPDHFPLADSKALLQVADKVASKGALVVLADMLGAPPSSRNSNTKKQGDATAKDAGTHYWPTHRWPLVKGRKVEYMAWYQSGPGSWVQLRPKLLSLLEAMQQQGLYDAPAAAAAADADQQQPEQQHTAASSSSSVDHKQQPQQGRPLGLMGIGWGTFIGMHAAGDDAVVAAGAKVFVALSPAMYNKDYDLTRQLQLPVALLPAKYDSMDQVMMFINLLAKPWELRCIFKRYGKLKPGWSSWLPQWTDIRAMRQVAEQLLTAVSWLKRELLGVTDGYELPEPQLPAKAGAASQAEVDAAVKKAEKKAAAEQAEAEAAAARE